MHTRVSMPPMARMSHFCRQLRLKPSASKTTSSVFHLHNTSATRELSSLSGWLVASAWVPPNLSWGDSRLYAVLQRTLDKDCRQAEEPKQRVDEASRFHSAVICSGALLFSSRVLRPSLVTLCSHKSGRCAVELYMHTRRRRMPPSHCSGILVLLGTRTSLDLAVYSSC